MSPHEPTEWYQFRRPLPTDPMNAPNLDTTDSLEKIEGAANPQVFADGVPFPTSGHKWGDRIFQGPGGSTSSVHVCLNDDDPFWGNQWMPIQDQNSPWRNIPTTAIIGTFTNSLTKPAGITVNNRGQLLFRGALTISEGLTNDSDSLIFNQLPEGLRPPADMSFIASIDPTVFDAGTTYEKIRYARVNILADGNSSVRFHGGTSFTTSTLWLNQIKYFIGRNDYVNT